MRHKTKTLAVLLAAAWALSACGEDVPANTINLDKPEGTVQTGGEELVVQVPAGAESVALVVQGLGSNLLLADKITSPSGKVVFDFQKDILDNLTRADDEVYTLVIPNNPDVVLEEGDWKVTFFTDANAELSLQVQGIFKTEVASAKAMDLNLYFVGLDDLSAEAAKTDETFQSILDGVEEIYGQAGISFGDVKFIEVPAGDAERFDPLQDTDLGDLFELSGKDLDAETNAQALNLFFVSDIEGGDAGFSLLGLSGGVPGPPTVNGTKKSGVVVNMADFPGEPDLIKLIMAHEAGHYLGLYHTTERNGAALNADGITGADHLSDTKTCPDSANTDGNDFLSVSECADFDGGNIMFFSPANDSTAMTSKQGKVMIANPIVR